MSGHLQIMDRGDPRKYYFQIPNIIDDMDLSLIAFRLYCHLKRVAGDEGRCWQSVETMANACKMSAGSIANAKKELLEYKLIEIEEKPRPGGGKPWQVIYIADIWALNMKKYQDEDQSTPDEYQSTLHEYQSTPDEIKNNTIKNNPIKNNDPLVSKKKLEDSPQPKINLFPLAQVLSVVTGLDLEKNKGRLFKEAKNYKPEDVERIKRIYGAGGEWYRSDWRGKRGERPRLGAIRETWGILGQPPPPPVRKNPRVIEHWENGELKLQLVEP